MVSSDFGGFKRVRSPFLLGEPNVAVLFFPVNLSKASTRFLFDLPYLSLTISCCWAEPVRLLGFFEFSGGRWDPNATSGSDDLLTIWDGASGDLLCMLGLRVKSECSVSKLAGASFARSSATPSKTEMAAFREDSSAKDSSWILANSFSMLGGRVGDRS